MASLNMVPANLSDRGEKAREVPSTSAASTEYKSDSSDAFAELDNVDGEYEVDEESLQREWSGSESSLLLRAKRQWTQEREAMECAERHLELASLLEQTREKFLVGQDGAHGPANRYGSNAHLPPFDSGKHVPVLALINPRSGALAGEDILAVARKTPYYQDRFFNIVDVVRDKRRGGLMDVFRQELNLAKEEAKALGVRPRIISGGGDGTASFTLFVIFSALCADDSRADEGMEDAGNGFIWSDEDLTEYFPAIAQMPLGTANDFGHTLGWGHKYPGAHAIGARRAVAAERALHEWISAVISPASRVVNFDLWGFMPLPGQEQCDFKVCELGGEQGWNPKTKINGNSHLVMKEAALPVPLFACLYFSAGMGAYLLSRFQINRRKSPLSNKLEYGRQIAGILTESVPSQLHPGLHGVSISCGSTPYFPPRSSEGNDGRRYREVGFLNVNWQAGMAHGADRAPVLGRVCSSREPAKFNDAKVDMFRLKVASAFRNGTSYQTDKKEGPMTLTYAGGEGKGLFFQWDGEARFAFSPSGGPFNINLRKILNIPVVLGHEFDARVTGDPDNGAKLEFAFSGETDAERKAARLRILRCVRGELNAELNASREEIVAAGFLCQEQ